MKYLRILLTVVFGFIYWPLNNLQGIVQKWYYKIEKEDKITYYLFTPIYWVFVALTFIICTPYELLIAKDLH